MTKNHRAPPLKKIISGKNEGGVRKPILGQTPVLEDGIILDVLDHPDMRFLTSVPNCSSLAGLEVPQEPPVLEVILGEC